MYQGSRWHRHNLQASEALDEHRELELQGRDRHQQDILCEFPFTSRPRAGMCDGHAALERSGTELVSLRVNQTVQTVTLSGIRPGPLVTGRLGVAGKS